MGRNLTSLPISASFQYLLQKSGSEVNDGLGADVDFLNISASYATSASIADTAGSATTATSASHAVNADSAISSSYAVTASFAENVTPINTGSFYVSSSITDATITFTQGDGSTEVVEVNNVSSSISASHAVQADSATSATTATSASHAVFADTAGSATTATSASHAVQADNALSADTATTASFVGDALYTGSVSSNVLTFTKGDGTTFDLTVNTGSAAATPTGSLLTTASAVDATITFTKGDGSTFPVEINNVSSSISASYAVTATSASHAVNADSAISASFATTASYAENAGGAAFPYTGSAEITGSLGVTGSIEGIGNVVIGNSNNSATGNYMAVVGGSGNTIAGSNYSGIFAGEGHSLTGANHNVILGGWNNTNNADNRGTILGGSNLTLTNGNVNGIGIGSYGTVEGGQGNFIFGNWGTYLYDAQNDAQKASMILNSPYSKLRGSASGTTRGYNKQSSIISSEYSEILGDSGSPTRFSGILYSSQSLIPAGTENSVIIARNAFTASADNTVYTPNLDVSGSLIVTGSTDIDGVLSLPGIADVSASIAAAGGGGAAFPYTGSAAILGTLDVNVSASADGYTITSGSLSGSLIDNLGQQTIVTGSAVKHIVNLSQAEYDALTPDTNTLYVIDGAETLGDTVVSGSFEVSGSSTFDDVTIAGTTTTSDVIVSGSLIGEVIPLSIVSNTASMDCSLGNMYTLVIDQQTDVHLSSSNIQAGQVINLNVTHDATNSGSLSFGSEFKFPGGTAPTITAAANSEDVLSFTAFRNTTLLGTSLLNFS